MVDNLSGTRILLVEDQYLVALHVREIIGDAGVEVIGPHSRAAEAVAALETHTVDGAILDINLAGDTVLDLVSALERNRTPFFFLTGLPPETLPEEFRGHAIVTKPFTPHQLLQAVADLFAKD